MGKRRELGEHAAPIARLGLSPRRAAAGEFGLVHLELEQIGFITVLDSWGQTLTYHPHLHCIVLGRGLSLDGTRWISCRSVEVL